jgi:hypothetical protein
VALRIAFDLDGVLADMEGELVRQAEALFGKALTRRLREQAAETPPEQETLNAEANPSKPSHPSGPRENGDPTLENAPQLVHLQLSARQQRRLWRHVETIENFWQTLVEIEPGSIARLAQIATARRWEIIFLTKRPQSAGATAQVQTQRWLESKGFSLPSVYVVQGSRGRIAEALGLDLVVDDRPENCLDVVVDSRARAILVWRDDDRQLPTAARRLGIGVVKSVNQCLDILTEVDTPAAEQPGVVSRVMRLLGLKEPAQV